MTSLDCACGAMKVWRARQCRACYDATRVSTCACGAAKKGRAKQCRACFVAEHGESRRMARQRMPRRCACGRRGPSPWHCPQPKCGRWKASADAVCEVCSTAERRAA